MRPFLGQQYYIPYAQHLLTHLFSEYFHIFLGFSIYVISFRDHTCLDKNKHDEIIVFIFAVAFLIKEAGASIRLVNSLFSDFIRWGELFSIGYFVSKYDILDKIGRKFKKSCVRVILSGITLVLVFGIKCVLGSSAGDFNMYILYTPPFVIALFYIVNFFEKLENRAVKGIVNGLEILGKNSMNLWLLHGIFFTPKASLQFIAYWPKYSIFIVMWVLALLLPFSYGVNKINRFRKVLSSGLKKIRACKNSKH